MQKEKIFSLEQQKKKQCKRIIRSKQNKTKNNLLNVENIRYPKKYPIQWPECVKSL